MSTTNRLFEEIVSEKNLHKAWVKVKNYAKSQDLYQNRYEFETFQQNLEANILTLKYEIENNHYEISPFREIRIPRPDGRIRKILFAKPQDRIVAQAIVNVIGPLFEVDFSKNSYGNRLNLDINEHIYIFKRWQDQYVEYSAKANKFLDSPPEFYYLKADIESFYDNIDTQRLLGLMSEEIEDPKVLSLIKQFLNVKIAENNAPVSGLPQGPAYSHFFANIYLNNFDILLEKESVDFVRYVDDLLILFKGKEDAIRAKEVIESHLESLKLKFNKDKTTDLLPITNTEYLIDDIKDIKYDLNLACNRKLTKELKGKIGTIFYEIFFETPELADINELSKHITYLLPRLKELETEETLIDTIYDILRAEPLKPHTTKIVILSLIGLTSGNLDQRFINLFEDAFSHLKILFIQSLPNSEELFTPIIKLIKKFSTDSNPLVRAAAVMKLAELQINLDTSSIREIYSKEGDPFVKKHYLYYLTKSGKTEILIPDILHYLRTHDEILKEEMQEIALWSLVTTENDSFIWTALSALDFEQIEYSSLSKLTHLCFYSCNQTLIQKYFDFVKKFDRDFILGVLESSFTNLRRRFLSSNNISKLMSLSDIYKYSDGNPFFNFLRKESFYILGDIRPAGGDNEQIREEIDHRTEDILAFEPQKEFIQKPDGLYFQRYKIRSTFYDFTFSGLQCYLITDTTANQNCVLEIVEERVIKTSTFISNFSEWKTVISEIFSKNLTPLIVCGEIDIEKTHCFYSIYAIPEGYELISTFLQKKNPLSEEETIKLLIEIASNANEGSKIGNFILHSINGYNLIVNHDLKVKLINLGLNLITPAYFSIFSNERNTYNDPTASFELLGFLAFEMLTKNCPVTEINNMKQNPSKERKYLSQSSLVKHISLHLRRILKKLTNVNLKYRYESFDEVIEDLNYLLRFKLNLSNFGKDKIILNKLEFFDFLAWVVESLTKKEFFIEKQKPLDLKIKNVLTEIFDVLVSFQQERDVKIIEIKNKYSKIKTLVPNRRIYRWLQLSTKQLIHFAIEYERQYDNLKQTQDRYFTLTPAALSLILALKLELYAFIRTLLFNWKTKEKRIEERIILLENILLPALKERPEKILISFEGNENKNAFEVSKIFPHENVERLLQIFKSLGNRKFESVHLPFQDFTLINAFLLLFCSDVSLLISNNKEPLELQPIFGDEEFLKKSHELEILIKNLNQLEAIIESYNYSGDKSGNGVCKDLKILFFEIVSSVNSLIIGKRKAKSLVSKFIILAKKGQIQIKRLIGVKKYDFDRNHILLGFEGDSSFIKPKDFVAVDLIKDKKDFSIVNVCPSSQNLGRLEKERLKEQWAVNLLAEIQSIYKNKFSSFHKVLVATIWIVLWLVILYMVVGFSKAILGAIIVQILTYIPLEYVRFYFLHEPG